MEVILRTELMPDYEAVFNLYTEVYGRPQEAKMIEDLRKSPQFIPELSIVMENDEQEIIGHILFTPVIIRSTNQNFPSLVLAPVALRSNDAESDLHERLMSYGMHMCRELGFSSVVVLGKQDYHPKYGFKPADQWNLQAPNEGVEERFMAVELRENALKNINGTVEYPDIFLQED